MSLNLSSQPFVNSRPVRRLVFVLWCLGALLLGANLFFYARHFTGQQERRDRLAELAEAQAREQERLAELEAVLDDFDIRWQNRQVQFLNLRIAERVFPWSRLFDRLTEALPGDVRLTRLRPDILGPSDARGGPEEIVRLEIRAEARSEEAMLGFVSRLFEHPAFRNPNLASENRRESITVFSLTVTYLPGRAGTDDPAREAPPPAEAVPGEAAAAPAAPPDAAVEPAAEGEDAAEPQEAAE